MRKESDNIKTRVLNDAELIKGGAEVDSEGNILPTEKQVVDIEARLKNAEEVILKLEGRACEMDFEELLTLGEQVPIDDMRRLREIDDYITTSGWNEFNSVQHYEDADAYKNSRERYLSDEYKYLRERGGDFDGKVDRLGKFFMKADEFARHYGLHVFALSEGSPVDNLRSWQLVKAMAAVFKSPQELIETIAQSHDAALYRAYAQKREVTGRM